MNRDRVIRFATVVLSILAGCTSASEAEREDERMKSAVPPRLLPDGSIRLSDQDRTTLGLVVEAVTEGELPDAVLRYGRARARFGQEALVVSPVSGRIPRAPAVELGAHVASGTALVDIIPVLGAAERVSLGVQGADVAGQIETTARELTLREQEAARAGQLAASGVGSTANVQTAEATVDTARARLDALKRARRVQLGGEGAAVTLRAPVDGTVVSLDADIGAITQAGAVLVRIVRPGPLWVDLSVPPEDPVGQGYQIALGTERVAARLVAKGAVVESDGTRHDRLEVEADQARGILPGMTIAVFIARDAAKGVVLPEAAVLPTPDADVVYVEREHNVFAPHIAEVVARFDARVRVRSGVELGEKVVVQGAASLRGETMRSELGHTE